MDGDEHVTGNPWDDLKIPLKGKETTLQRPRHIRGREANRYADFYDRPEALSRFLDFVPYMIETHQYGHHVCFGIPLIYYTVSDDWQRLTEEPAVLWSIVQCPWKTVAFTILIEGVVGGRPIGHANLLLVNKHTQPWEIERFEPHGVKPNDTSPMRKID